MLEKHYSVKELSQLLPLKPYTLREKIRNGEFDPKVKAGNEYLVPESSVQAYLDRHTEISTVPETKRLLSTKRSKKAITPTVKKITMAMIMEGAPQNV